MIDVSTVPIVYMWVDASDPAYKSRHGLLGPTSRNRDNKELLFSLRSLEMYMPWWKGVLYLVTDKQVPTWIRTTNPRLKVVDHADIIPKEYLPTRVSNTIEWFLHLIPGIDDYFIAMNDDFMLLKPCDPSMFFKEDDKPNLPFNTNMLVNTKDSPKQNKEVKKMWLCNVHNSMNLLEEKLGKPFDKKFYIQHAPRIFSKRILSQLQYLMGKEIRASILLKERTYETLDTMYILNYYMAAVLKLDIVPRTQTEYFLEINDTTNIHEQFSIIQNNTSCHFLCLNDNFTTDYIPDVIKSRCADLFPVPSSFEIENVLSVVSLPFKDNYRFVSFYSEGPPHDGGYNLSIYESLSRNLLKNQCHIELYTPRRLRELGYDYAVKEYPDRGCVTGNPNAEKLGFYAWKPLILLLELEKMKDGDILLFHDLNIDKYPAYRDNFANIFTYAEACLRECGFDFFVSRENYVKRIFHHCKAVTIREMGADHPYFYNFPQAIVNIMFIRKSDASMALIKEWVDACKVERWITGTPNDDPHQGFIYHCPEQGILCMLLAKWVAEQKYNIPIDYPRQIFYNRRISSRIIPSRINYMHLDYLLDYKGIKTLTSMPNFNCVRFVSFFSDGAPPGIFSGYKKLVDTRCKSTYYTAARLCELGYEDTIQQFEYETTNKFINYAKTQGFFMWKPLLLWLELQDMKDGDLVVYLQPDMPQHDLRGFHLIGDICDTSWACLRESKFDFFVPREDMGLTIETNCDRAVIEQLGGTHSYYSQFPQINTNFICIRKSAASVALVEEWMEACKNKAWLCPQSTLEHRGEQSILNLIIAKWVAERKHDIPLHYPNVEFMSKVLRNRKEVDSKEYSYLNTLYEYSVTKSRSS